jgi:hypothetical protein
VLRVVGSSAEFAQGDVETVRISTPNVSHTWTPAVTPTAQCASRVAGTHRTKCHYHAQLCTCRTPCPSPARSCLGTNNVITEHRCTAAGCRRRTAPWQHRAVEGPFQEAGPRLHHMAEVNGGRSYLGGPFRLRHAAVWLPQGVLALAAEAGQRRALHVLHGAWDHVEAVHATSTPAVLIR